MIRIICKKREIQESFITLKNKKVNQYSVFSLWACLLLFYFYGTLKRNVILTRNVWNDLLDDWFSLLLALSWWYLLP